jgi:drug/metabolite transporter (DMT)-like permease
MSVLSPLTALVAAVVPMGWGLLHGELVSPVGSVGIATALVAVVLIAFVPERTAVRATPRGIAMAVGSGAMIGVFLVLIDASPHDSGLVPLLANRAVNAVLMFTAVAILAARRRPEETRDLRHGIRLAVLCGVLDGTANALLLAGLRTGELTVVSVLTALYPAGTIALAALVLRERVTRLQTAGLLLALVAAALLAIG